ncbi:coiled-coil domain-containing protein 9 [Rhinophrynus dorsalis]
MASVVDLKSKEEKDAELDRKIEALRKKNEALVRRHQLIEEDRKRAEQEGIAVTTPRKPGKPQETEPDKARKEKENLSIIVDVSAGEKRVVNNGKPAKITHPSNRGDTSPRSPTRRTSGRTGLFSEGRSPHTERTEEPFVREDNAHHSSERPSRGRRSQGGEVLRRSPRGSGDPGERWAPSPRGGAARAERGGRGPGRGGGTPGRGGGPGGSVDAASGPDRKNKEWEEKRRQNIEKMNEEMEKIAEYERSQRDGMREKNPIRNFLDDPRRSGPVAEGDRKEGSRRHIRNWGGPDFERVKTGMDREKDSHVRRPGMKNQMDMTMSMTGRERAEYARWKSEREQIDQERLARHRKPTGQWRREWDAEKTDSMFKEDASTHVEAEPFDRRDKGKRGAPKPPTIGEFLTESFASSGRKKDRNRGKGSSKPYSAHDTRWEEPEDEKEKEVVVEGGEKETCIEKVEEAKVETPKEPRREEEIEKHVEDDDDEWEECSEEECSDYSEAEDEPGEESLDAASATCQPTAKEQRLPHQSETPKLSVDPPAETPEAEKTADTNPTSPFSPKSSRITSDWGEEMELVSPFGSTGDSPPQASNTREFIPDVRGSPTDPESAGTGTLQKPMEGQVQNVSEVIESASLKPTEAKTGCDSQEEMATESETQEPATKSTNVLPPAEESEQATVDDGKVEVTSPATEESKALAEEPIPLPEVHEPAADSVFITNFETVCFRKDLL